ncbi:MAG: 2'-deoxycytidine 5'-triphosphate deaminase, partial [Pseudomonadota bacterium]
MIGVLPSQALTTLITDSAITASPAILPEQIQPASLD